MSPVDHAALVRAGQGPRQGLEQGQSRAVVEAAGVEVLLGGQALDPLEGQEGPSVRGVPRVQDRGQVGVA